MLLRVRRLCKSVRLPLTLLAALASVAPCALASTATTTTLAITSGGTPVTSITSGAVVTLTATIKAGTTPVTPGQVNFCDATATYCTDVHLIATAQLTSNGTATYKFIPGPGTHNYKAVFVGTHLAATSSASTSLQVTAATTTTISSSGAAGNYTLNASVASNGLTAPTGSVSFLDTSNANYLLGTFTLSPTALTSSFTGNSITSTNDGYSIAVADFNGDGISDIASVNGSSSVTIRLGNGDGTFRSSSVSIMNISALQAVAADFNDDGIPDLALRNEGSLVPGSVVILLGKGDGTFTQAPTPLVTNTNAFVITTADFNGDGEADLAVANAANGTITSLLGHGDGTFTSVTSPISAAAFFLPAADFNGDGIPDLVAFTGTSTLGILIGNGDGTFTQKSTVTPPLRFYFTEYAVSVADFNLDGHADLAVVDNYGVDPLFLYLGKGDGTFTLAPSTPPASVSSYQTIVADLNGDGIPDLAVPDYNVNYTYILFGKGDGTFTQAPYNVAAGLYELLGVTADFNGDGRTDLALSTYSSIEIELANSTSLSTATLTPISPVGTGTHYAQASYPGDTLNAPSTSNLTPLTAQPVPTTLAVTANPATTTYGQQVALTATLSPYLAQNHSASGSVAFSSNGTPIGTGPITSGVASLNTTSLAHGTDSITATYPGDTNFVTSNGTGSATVNWATTTTLASSLNPSVSSQFVTFTATLSSANGTPTGSVNFTDGTTTLATVTLNAAGQATYTTTGLTSVGAHTITATYTPTGIFAASSATLTQTILPPYTTTSTLSCNPTTVIGQPFLLGVTVSAPYGTPTGSVTITDNGNPLATAPLFNGMATATPSALTIGTHTFVASYPGVGIYAASSATCTTTVTTIPTYTTLTSSLNPSVTTQAVTLTATLSSISTGKPTGSVTFTDGTTILATITVNAFGQASYTSSTLAIGSHTITATYSPTGNFAASSSTLTQTVLPPYPTTSTLTCTPSTVIIGQPFTLAIAVSTSAATPTGSVTITDTGNPFATLTLTNGAASQTTSALAVGTHTFLASFPAAGIFAASTATCTATVILAPTTTSITSSLNPSAYNQSVTFTATTTITGSASIPTGLVGFTDGATLLATVPLNAAGQATYTTNTLLPATHIIAAAYSGSSTTATSVSPAVYELVKSPALTATLTTAPNPSAAFQPIQFSAQVAATPTTTTPTLSGTVTFSTSTPPTVVLGTAPINASGVATLTANPNLGGGFYTMVASFSGTATYNGTALAASATSPLAFQVVSSAPTSIALTATPTAVILGHPVVLTATLSDAPSTQLPTGSITFTEPSTGNTLGSSAIGPNGVATLTVSNLPLGTHQLLATFPGSTNFLPAQSALVTVTVEQQDFAVTFTPPTLTLETLHTTSTPFTLTSLGLLADTFDLTCTNLPPDSTCNPISPSISLTSGQSITSSVRIVALIPVLSLNHPADGPFRRIPPAALAATLLPLTLLLRRKRTRHLRLLATLILSLAALNNLTGCTAFGYSPAHPAPGTYTLTLTATGRTTGITHSTPLTLTITP